VRSRAAAGSSPGPAWKYHNLRIGSRLLDTALDWLASGGRTPLYVGVWSGNLGAQRLYGRYGFTKVGEHGFPVGGTLDRELILRRCDP
jgi:diamine N-acetyltransferase